jgi:hypothetical protein
MSFSAEVAAWIAKTKNAANAVLRQSAQELFQEAQTVGPSVANPSGGEGGRLPVDTGFMRSSFGVSIGSMPAGPTSGSPNQTYRYDAGGVTLKLAGAELGDTICGGWAAQYAQFMEMRYGFMRSAAQNWPSIVNSVAQRAIARYG